MAFLLWQRVRDAAEREPDRIAVSDRNGQATYGELMADADRVTHVLVSAGVGPGDRVGLLATKSIRCVASMIGVLQAGASYVPVDPRAPARRSKFILANAGVRFLVSEPSMVRALDLRWGADGVPGASQVLLLDDAGERDVAHGGPLTWLDVRSADAARTRPPRNEFDPAYMLYTSGSTGKPKGVVISHRNALTFVDWGRHTFELGPEDRLSSHAPFHFDLSVFDLYGALSSGGSVHLIPDQVAPFPAALASWIDETRISVWYSVPSALVRLLLHGDLSRYSYDHLRTVLFAGEVFPIKHLRAVMEAFPASGFHNLYGPTETNVCTYYSVPRPLPKDMADLPIGESCANMEAFALTESGTRAEEGEEGELLVRGPCVMLGYWALPQRTAQSLTPSPLHADFHDPVYRTGDHVRVLAGGGFQFLGRKDHMVKVRGYRVELGEVETALHDHPGVREAAVVAIADEEVGARLKGAVAFEEGMEATIADVIQHCRGRVPRYAVPEELIVVDALPRTSTGKTDRVTLMGRLSDERSPLTSA